MSRPEASNYRVKTSSYKTQLRKMNSYLALVTQNSYKNSSFDLTGFRKTLNFTLSYELEG